MPRFVVETTEEVPNILLIGGGEVGVRLLDQELVQKNVRVVLTSPIEVIKTPKILLENWQKIIWYVGDLSAPTQEQTNLLVVLRQLFQIQVVGYFHPLIQTTDKRLSLLSHKTEQVLSNIGLIQTSLPQAQYFFGEGVVEDNFRELFSLFLMGEDRDDLAVLDAEIGFCRLSSFIQRVIALTFRPQVHAVLIRGEQGKMSGWIQGWVSALREEGKEVRENTEGIKGVRIELPFEKNVIREVGFREELQQILKENVKTLVGTTVDSVEEKLLTSPIQSSKENEYLQLKVGQSPRSTYRVAPIVPPKIENRLRRYNERMAGVKQRVRLRRPLRRSELEFIPKQDSPVWALSQLPHVEKDIHRVFASARVAQKTARVQTQAEKVVAQTSRNSRQTVFFRSLIILGTIGVFGLGLVGAFVFPAQQLRTSIFQVLANLAQNTPSEWLQTPNKLMRWQQIVEPQVVAYKAVLGTDVMEGTSLFLSIGQTITQGIKEEGEIVKLRQLAIDQVLGRSEGKIFDTLLSLSGKEQTQYSRLSLLPGQIKKIDEHDLSDDQKRTLDGFQTTLSRKRKDLASLEQLQQVLPGFFAQEGRKTYLVVLQNNQELRPSGGLLTGCVLITIEKGVVADYQFFEISSLDQLFQGTVAPPQELKTYLGEKNWRFRDANWSASFPESAQQIAWFFEKSSGKKVDGVIGLNVIVLQNILRAFGPLSLPGTGETVTANNIREKVEFHTEARFTSTARGEYLVELTRQLFGQFFAAPTPQVLSVLGALDDDLRNGQMNIFSSDIGTQSVLQNLGWSGEVMLPDCPPQLHAPTEPCIVDPIYQVEANVGVNRANFTLGRTIAQNIHLTPEKIEHERVVTWVNNANSNAWPAGPYKVYTRFYLPSGANFNKIEIDGVPVTEAALVKKNENNRLVIGVFTEVPIQKSTKLVLKYDEPMTSKNPYSYAFFDQKQPGTEPDPVAVTLTYDSSLRPVLIAPQAEVRNNAVVFTLQKDKHTFVGVRFH